MEQLATEVHALAGAHRPPATSLIAESDLNDPRLVTAAEAGGYGLDAQWSDDFHHALFAIAHRRPRRLLCRLRLASPTSPKPSAKSSSTTAGTRPFAIASHGRPVRNLPASRFLGYAQNHDQVGNRAKGDRLSSIVTSGRAKIAAVLVLTAPFIPMLFQGEEWAASSPFQFFTNHNPELGKLVSAGRRKEFAAFGWNPADIPDPQSPATFQRSKLNWDERTTAPHSEMLDWYKKLIALRRSTSDLTDPDLAHIQVRYSDAEQWLVMERGAVTVAFSLAAQPIRLEVRPGSTLALASSPDIQVNSNSLTLPPDSVAVLTSE